jgi:hypothetical protein
MMPIVPADVSSRGYTWSTSSPTDHAGAFVWPGRRVLQIRGHVWPYPPSTCPMGDFDTQWLCEGTVLVCSGCGLDCT